MGGSQVYESQPAGRPTWAARRTEIESFPGGYRIHGEYPARKPGDPDDWDERELGQLRDHGIRLIQLHEEWNDSQRLNGADKYAPVNPAGFRRFVDMVHRCGMKLIVYVSTGFFRRTDPDFREEWARKQDIVEIYWRYARCSPASPGWRSYLLPKLMRILDNYGVDGLYNDAGYVKLWNNPQPPTLDEALAFNESVTGDGAECDLLALIYAEVKRRNGIVKLHISGANRPQTDLKVYDCLRVGEGGRDGDKLRTIVKNHPPDVAPCLDMSRARVDNEDELYLRAENQALKEKLGKKRILLNDDLRRRLAIKGKVLGRKALQGFASIVPLIPSFVGIANWLPGNWIRASDVGNWGALANLGHPVSNRSTAAQLRDIRISSSRGILYCCPLDSAGLTCLTWAIPSPVESADTSICHR